MLNNLIALFALGGLICLGCMLLVSLGRFVIALVQALVPLSMVVIVLAILYQLLTQHLR